MAGGGGKGGKTETTTRLDPRLEEGAASAVAGALQSAGLDYSPNRGATIAAFTPQQQAAFQGANEAAAAFGLPTGGVNMPAAESMGGIEGYSTGGLYDEMLKKSMTPQQQQERGNILDFYSQQGQKIKGMEGLGPAGGGGK